MYISYANCRNVEQNLNDCELSGMTITDRVFCNPKHEAGVRCFVNETQTLKKPSVSHIIFYLLYYFLHFVLDQTC